MKLRSYQYSLCIYGTKDERVVHTVNELKKIGSSIYSIENADHVYSHTLYMDKLFMQTYEWLEGERINNDCIRIKSIRP